MLATPAELMAEFLTVERHKVREAATVWFSTIQGDASASSR